MRKRGRDRRETERRGREESEEKEGRDKAEIRMGGSCLTSHLRFVIFVIFLHASNQISVHYQQSHIHISPSME